jgi:hypothetical protein
MVERAGVAGGGGTWEGGVAHRSRVLTSGDMCGVHLHPVGVDFSYGSIFDQAMVLRVRVVAMPQYTARDNGHADGVSRFGLMTRQTTGTKSDDTEKQRRIAVPPSTHSRTHVAPALPPTCATECGPSNEQLPLTWSQSPTDEADPMHARAPSRLVRNRLAPAPSHLSPTSPQRPRPSHSTHTDTPRTLRPCSPSH